jgi:SAM-dependent methyltransferase
VRERHLDLAAARFANSSGVDFVNADISTLGEEFEDRFRTVVAVNVLEHVPDDLLALRRIHACLEPGGHLLLWVPAHPLLFGRVDNAISHQRRYQARGLLEQLSRAGFAVHRWQFVNPIGAVGWLVNGRVLRRSSIPVAAVRSHERLLGMSRWLETLTRGHFGLSLMVVAQRPAVPIPPVSGSAESPTETRILEEQPSVRR